jgi:hypothetical protein
LLKHSNRATFNEARPHAALGNRAPAKVYQASWRRYPRLLKRPEPGAWCRTELGLVAYEVWEVEWGVILLGRRRYQRGEGHDSERDRCRRAACADGSPMALLSPPRTANLLGALGTPAAGHLFAGGPKSCDLRMG